jgi:two-component system response regulator QseB
MRILLVEDDPQLGRATQIGLEQRGHAVDWVSNGQSAPTTLAIHHYDCLLLDLGLPGEDGMSVLRKLRAGGFPGAILIVTARDQVSDRVTGLDGGADDFVIKPFDLNELAARIRSATRRSSGRTRETMHHNDLEVDVSARIVRRQGETIALSAKEFGLLLRLLEQAGQILTRAQLEESLYGWGDEIESNAIQVHVHHLRKKLGRDLIRTIHAVGYTIDRPADGHGR